MYPSLFISHGAPNTILYENSTKQSLKLLATTIKKPKFIVVVSAHWITKNLEIINPSANKLMYDFYGFEKELYEYKYNIKSDLKYTNQVIDNLKDFDIKLSNKTSYDHGVWTVLAMMYENLEIPVINLSLPINYNADELFLLGENLKSLRDEPLLIFSGSLTHNLYDLSSNIDTKIKDYTKYFTDEIRHILKIGDKNRFLDYENIKYFRQNHPTLEHFLPLLIAVGSSNTYKAKSFNNQIVYSNLSMENFIFRN